MAYRTFVDIHILQSLPPSNVNRDDAGSPKEAVYGGARRARVSSQAWKRATREEFAQELPREKLATRTRRIAALLEDRLCERTNLDAQQAQRLSTHLLSSLKIKAGKKKAEETAYLLFFGRAQLESIVDTVADRAEELADLDDKSLAAALGDVDVQEKLTKGHPIDVALFGRMVADLPNLNVDAATQVAHALSTHAVETEFDYFTAVDDENKEGETGAGMIGTIEFNSATLYRFATVGVHQLVDNLGGDQKHALEALRLFIATFARSMPTGHQNSFAHQTLPSVISVVVRGDQPINLVSAFEEPVSGASGLLAASAKRLAAELRCATQMWGLEPLLIASMYDEAHSADLAKDFGPALVFGELLDSVGETVQQRLAR